MGRSRGGLTTKIHALVDAMETSQSIPVSQIHSQFQFGIDWEVFMARFDLTDFEWSVIQPLLPNKPRGVPRVDDTARIERHFLAFADGGAVG